MKFIIKVIYFNNDETKSIVSFNISDKKLFDELIQYKCPVRFDKVLYSNKNNFQELHQYKENENNHIVTLDFSNRMLEYLGTDVYDVILFRNDHDTFINNTQTQQDKYGNYI